ALALPGEHRFRRVYALVEERAHAADVVGGDGVGGEVHRGFLTGGGVAEGGVATGDQLGDGGADVLEARPDGESLRVPVVDAFQDHRELEVSEADIPVEPRQAATT